MRKFLVFALAALVVLSTIHACRQSHDKPTPCFEGPSTKLKQTKIVPTLDTSISKGKNVIWCASFLSAWKALQNDITHGPINLENAKGYCDLLNNTPDPRKEIPEEIFYTTAGWVTEGIIQTITDNLKKKFPSKAPPTFPGIVPNSFLAYAYLEANVRFALPYFQNEEPLTFKDSQEHKTRINSFGMRYSGNPSAYEQLKTQIGILFKKGNDKRRLLTSNSKSQSEELIFALDLCVSSAPSQIVVARMPREKTLSATLAKLEENITQFNNSTATSHSSKMGPNDVVRVPDIFYRVSHEWH